MDYFTYSSGRYREPTTIRWYAVKSQDNDCVHITNNGGCISIKPKCRGAILLAFNVYFGDMLVGSFDTLQEAARWLNDNIVIVEERCV